MDDERNKRHEMLRKKLRQKRTEARGGGGSHTRQNIDPASLLMSLGVEDVNLLQAATAVTPAMIKTLSQSTAAPHTTATYARSSRDQTGAKKDTKDKDENKEVNKEESKEESKKENKADEDDDEEAPPVLW